MLFEYTMEQEEIFNYLYRKDEFDKLLLDKEPMKYVLLSEEKLKERFQKDINTLPISTHHDKNDLKKYGFKLKVKNYQRIKDVCVESDYEKLDNWYNRALVYQTHSHNMNLLREVRNKHLNQYITKHYTLKELINIRNEFNKIKVDSNGSLVFSDEFPNSTGLRCDDCDRLDAYDSHCPYEDEINDTIVEMNLCEECYNEREMNI